MRIVDAALRLLGATSGEQIIKTAAAASGQITLPAGTTDFSATGGTSQVVKQTTAGGAFTVAQLAATDVTGVVAVSSGGTGQTSYTNGQMLIGNTTGNTLAKATLTAGTGITVTNGAGAVTVAQTAGATRLSSGALNPAATTLTSLRMCGLNQTITPATTGTILIVITGQMGNSGTGNGCLLQGATGTGTPPANAATASGTLFSTYNAITAVGGNNFAYPFATNTIVTGAAIGVALWIDLQQATVTAGTAFAQNIIVTAVEI